MDIHEELKKKMVLEKPEKIPKFKAGNNKKAKVKVKSFGRNEGLYESMESDLSDFDVPVKIQTEAEVRSKILECNGGDTYSDKVIVAKWKKNVDSDSNHSEAYEASNKNFYKKNVLMRNLLDQQMNKLKLAEPDSSDSASGKDKENFDVNNQDGEGPHLTQSVDDPDFYYLRDTTKRDKVIDDGFRFSYRGVKTTTTPRSYAIYELVEEDFAFTKK